MSASSLLPSIQDFKRGYKAFQENEQRDAMYKTASFLVCHFWGKHKEMADGLGVLLLTWNQAFYRYGLFDFDKLEQCIKQNQVEIDSLRRRSILNLSECDAELVRSLFKQFLEALAITNGKKKGTRSPVAASKALHLLAPEFFALWDDKIARAYSCYYNEMPADMYWKFMIMMRDFASELPKNLASDMPGKSLVKLIDEYNYAKYTKEWV